MVSNRIGWETLRTFNSATLNGTFQALGSPLGFPSYILKMVNNSNVAVTISIDGATEIDVCPASSFWLYDEGKVGSFANIPAVSTGTQIYIKGSAGTGNIYLVSQYLT